jgi:hypothetical protein
MQDATICFCKRDIMTVCTANSHEQQKRCRYYEKSSHFDRCMYFVFDRYCDCLNAQLAFKDPSRSCYKYPEEFEIY